MIPLIAATCWLVLYLGACFVVPFARCGRCKGVGFRAAGLARKTRRCGSCKGEGKHLRAGRRAYNYFARVRREGTRYR